MYFISQKFVWIPFYAFLLFLLYKKYKFQTIYLLFLVLFLTVLSDQSTVFFKNYFQRLRPCHNPEIIEMVHLVKNYCGGTYGFVSSHASNTFSLAVFIIFYLRYSYRWITVSLVLWASVVSYSRIYLGAHYPLDVLAGAVWGIFITLLIITTCNKIKPQFFNPYKL
jgi:undecaprenyl-diphosphatase